MHQEINFINNPGTHANLNLTKNETKTLAVEMEGAAVAQVCEDYNIPYIVIRIISDKADNSAHIDFSLFVKSIANKYSSGIVQEFINSYIAKSEA